MNEQEEFEFRLRAEQEAAQAAQSPVEQPSSLAVAGNAAAKGIAGVGDMVMNVAGSVGNALIPPGLRPGAMQNPVQEGMKAVGLIRPENEPQTPGQRILDMAVQAGVGTAVMPVSGVANAVKNVAMGVTSGTAAGVTKEATGSDLAALAVGMATPFASKIPGMSRANAPTLSNPVKTATIKDAQAAGYVLNPSAVKPSFTNNRLESVAGKAAVKQEAATRNQQVTNTLAAKALGLPDGTPITPDAIAKVRDIAAKPYQEVEKLRPTLNMPWFPRYHSASLLDELKQARADAQQTFTQYNRNADPATLAKAKAFRAEAESLEKDIERVAQAAGKPELMAQLKAGRQLYARTYDVERATNFADGNVSARVLGMMAKKGKPLTGELAVIGKFARAFPSLTREGASIPSAGVSGTDAAASALLGTVGYGAVGGPAGILAAGAPLLRGPARSFLLSQSKLGIPGTTGYQQRLLAEPPQLNQAMLQSILGGRAISESP